MNNTHENKSLYKSGIYQQICAEVDAFLNYESEIVPGWTFNQYDTVKKCILYENSRFDSDPYYMAGNIKKRRGFYNITNWRCSTASKMIDSDISDIQLISKNEDSDFGVHLLESVVKERMAEDDWSRLLNDISDDLPKYGSCVLIKDGKHSHLLDLRYLYNDPEAKTLEQARYINIKENMTLPELKKRGLYKEGIEEYLQNSPNQMSQSMTISSGIVKKSVGTPYIEVWHRYGFVPKEWLTNDAGDAFDYVFAHFIVCGKVTQVIDTNGNKFDKYDHMVISGKEIKALPFIEVHYRKARGRWLGWGIIEEMFELQRVYNQLMHYQLENSEIESLQLFQTDDSSLRDQNISNLVTGQLIQYNGDPITRVPTEVRGGTVTSAMLGVVDNLADKTTFSYDIVRGEQAPATATLGSVQIQSNAATSLFDYKKENVNIMLNKFIKELIVPEIIKEFKNGGVMKFVNTFEEINKLKQNYANKYANKALADSFMKGEEVNMEKYEATKQVALNQLLSVKPELRIELGNDYFEGLKFDVVIDNENANLTTESSNYLQLLQLIQGDPTVMTDPAKRKVLFTVMRKMGMSGSEIDGIGDVISQSQNPNQILSDAANMAQSGMQPQV